jgi:hypothetical protein
MYKAREIAGWGNDVSRMLSAGCGNGMQLATLLNLRDVSIKCTSGRSVHIMVILVVLPAGITGV